MTPALSKKQARLMRIAEHYPEKLYKENRGVLNMSKGQLHDFAKTGEKGLPERKRKRKETMKRFVKRRNRREGK